MNSSEDKPWVLEISESQRCFNVDLLEKSLQNNLLQAERFFSGEMGKNEVHDYRPLFIGTREQVYEFSKKYREHIVGINPRHATFGTLEGMWEEIQIDEARVAAPTN